MPPSELDKQTGQSFILFFLTCSIITHDNTVVNHVRLNNNKKEKQRKWLCYKDYVRIMEDMANKK